MLFSQRKAARRRSTASDVVCASILDSWCKESKRRDKTFVCSSVGSASSGRVGSFCSRTKPATAPREAHPLDWLFHLGAMAEADPPTRSESYFCRVVLMKSRCLMVRSNTGSLLRGNFPEWRRTTQCTLFSTAAHGHDVGP